MAYYWTTDHLGKKAITRMDICGDWITWSISGPKDDWETEK